MLRLYVNDSLHWAVIYDNVGNVFRALLGKNISLSYTSNSNILSVFVDNGRIDSLKETFLIDEYKMENRILCKNYNISDITCDFKKLPTSFFERKYLVIVKSQSDKPICIYSCDNVNYESLKDFPRTTKMNIDDTIIYLHSVNFAIIETSLIQN